MVEFCLDVWCDCIKSHTLNHKLNAQFRHCWPNFEVIFTVFGLSIYLLFCRKPYGGGEWHEMESSTNQMRCRGLFCCCRCFCTLTHVSFFSSFIRKKTVWVSCFFFPCSVSENWMVIHQILCTQIHSWICLQVCVCVFVLFFKREKKYSLAKCRKMCWKGVCFSVYLCVYATKSIFINCKRERKILRPKWKFEQYEPFRIDANAVC